MFCLITSYKLTMIPSCCFMVLFKLLIYGIRSSILFKWKSCSEPACFIFSISFSMPFFWFILSSILKYSYESSSYTCLSRFNLFSSFAYFSFNISLPDSVFFNKSIYIFNSLIEVALSTFFFKVIFCSSNLSFSLVREANSLLTLLFADLIKSSFLSASYNSFYLLSSYFAIFLTLSLITSSSSSNGS